MARKTSSSEGWWSWRFSHSSPSCVERAHDLREADATVVQAHRDALGGRDELAEAVEDRRPSDRGRRGRRESPRPCGRPTSAFSAAGVPSATIRPWSMIPTRSARTSASSRYWVVRKTVTPSSLARRPTSPQSAVRLWTSRPVVGSSRKRISRPVHEREGEVEPALHPARVAAHLAVGRLASGRRGRAARPSGACARRAGCPAARPAGAGARGRSAAGRARPPAAPRRCASAPAAPGGRRRSRPPARCPRSAAAASSACARSSICRRRSAREIRRSRPAATARSIASTARGPFLNSRTSWSAWIAGSDTALSLLECLRLSNTYHLKYTSWMHGDVEDAVGGARGAAVLLRDRHGAAREGRRGSSAELGLGFAQAHALRMLDPEEPLPMSALAERLFCDASNVTGIVDRLESRGLVERAQRRGRPPREGADAHGRRGRAPRPRCWPS